MEILSLSACSLISSCNSVWNLEEAAHKTFFDNKMNEFHSMNELFQNLLP